MDKVQQVEQLLVDLTELLDDMTVEELNQVKVELKIRKYVKRNVEEE